MHVYACICMYLNIYACMMPPLEGHSVCDIVYAHICMYIVLAQVSVCICMYMTYMHVYCKYMHACISSYDPLHHWDCCHLLKSQSLWTPSSGPNSGHPWACGKLVLFVIGNIVADPISGTTPLSTPPGPLLHPPVSARKPPTP